MGFHWKKRHVSVTDGWGLSMVGFDIMWYSITLLPLWAYLQYATVQLRLLTKMILVLPFFDFNAIGKVSE